MISWRARLLNGVLRLTYKRRLEKIRSITPAAVERSRRRLAAMAKGIPSPPANVTIEPVQAAGIRGEWVIAPNSLANRVILYLHGGAYALGSPSLYRDFAWRFSEAAAAKLLVVDYRLAPEHPFPAALEDAQAVWHWLLSMPLRPDHILIAGDSAGGGLSLATLIALRDSGGDLPAGAVCFSPWTDLSGSGPSLGFNAERDPFLIARLLAQVAALYLGNADPGNALVSPVFGDPVGLPPLLIHVGSTEILLSDSARFAKNARAAGVDVTLRIWERMPHIFHLFARYVPEGKRVIKESGDFARERFSTA